MSGAELELAAADSVPALVRRKAGAFGRKGEPCANCGAVLEGPFCHDCGQSADTHHRNILHLTLEAIEGMFHLDGRLARTVPLLFFKPGVLAKDLMEGRIVRHTPPFRTFLVALLLFIFAAEHAIHRVQHEAEVAIEQRTERLKTPEGRKAEADRLRVAAGEARRTALAGAREARDEKVAARTASNAQILADYAEAERRIETKYAQAMARAAQLETDPNAAGLMVGSPEEVSRAAADQIRGLNVQIGKTPQSEGLHADGAVTVGEHGEASLKANIAKAVENPQYFFLVLFGWAHRLAVLLLPIMGLSLTLVYLNRRQFYVYDHLLVATNLLSFAFLTNALGLVLPWSIGQYWFLILMFWTPVNLFQTLRGGYGSTLVGAAFKTLVVWTVSVVAFSSLVAGLVIFTLSQL